MPRRPRLGRRWNRPRQLAETRMARLWAQRMARVRCDTRDIASLWEGTGSDRSLRGERIGWVFSHPSNPRLPENSWYYPGVAGVRALARAYGWCGLPLERRSLW